MIENLFFKIMAIILLGIWVGGLFRASHIPSYAVLIVSLILLVISLIAGIAEGHPITDFWPGVIVILSIVLVFYPSYCFFQWAVDKKIIKE